MTGTSSVGGSVNLTQILTLIQKAEDALRQPANRYHRRLALQAIHQLRKLLQHETLHFRL